MRNVSMTKAILMYESYFITKLGMELGDEKWLKKNIIDFRQAEKLVADQFIKVFRRVIKLYLKKKFNIEKLYISIRSSKNATVAIEHPATKTLYLYGQPRSSLRELYQSIRGENRTSIYHISYNGYHGGNYPRLSIKMYLSYTYINPVLNNFSKVVSYFEFITKIDELVDKIIKYHNAERAKFEEDLTYIFSESPNTQKHINFKYVDMPNLKPVFDLIDGII